MQSRADPFQSGRMLAKTLCQPCVLDAAVCAAYGWPAAPERPGEGVPVRQAQGEPAEMSDDQILEGLLQVNTQRAMQEDGKAVEAERREQNL